jgi:hypothetical protein
LKCAWFWPFSQERADFIGDDARSLKVDEVLQEAHPGTLKKSKITIFQNS